ncbi:MAG: hypothetical protein EOP34_02845 [Rickettsiales bacterium]|nr:MAG: hypothetical protein EOP34_02845 [Rickettsiales bacterium]
MTDDISKIFNINDKEHLSVGKRIKLVRTLANLTRKHMFNKYGIIPSTLRAWEDDVNQLTSHNATRLYEAFRREGIPITKNWILNGSNTRNERDSVGNDELDDIFEIETNLRIFEEIKFFKKSYRNSITIEITDDGLYPIYESSNYVGGINVTNDNLIESLIGKFCIITASDNKTYIKKIFRRESNGSYLVGTINPLANIEGPSNFSCIIKSAAHVIRRWCQYD